MKDDLLPDVERLWIKRLPESFPFEKEVVFYLFKVWTLIPEFGPNRANTAGLIGAIITLNRYDGNDRPLPGAVRSLAELLRTIQASWYEKFYKAFYSKDWVGGVGSIIHGIFRAPLKQDARIINAERSRQISFDILDFLIRTARHHPEFARVDVAMHFIVSNGFDRSPPYNLRPGERKKQPTTGFDTVHKNWKHCNRTLGLDYVLTTGMPESNNLRLNDKRFLVTLSQLAHEDRQIQLVLSQYHWLVDFLRSDFHSLKKVKHWPYISGFEGRAPLNIRPLTGQEISIARKSLELAKKRAKG